MPSFDQGDAASARSLRCPVPQVSEEWCTDRSMRDENSRLFKTRGDDLAWCGTK